MKPVTQIETGMYFGDPTPHEMNATEIEAARDRIAGLEQQIKKARRSWTPYVFAAIGAALCWRLSSQAELAILGSCIGAAVGALLKAAEIIELRSELEGEKTRLTIRIFRA
jgi:hypothetical protein